MRDCSWRLLNGLYQLRGEKTWVAEATEELAGRQQLRAEVSQMISGCSEKKLLREEVPQRRGASAKRSLSEEVAQQRTVGTVAHSSIHPPMRKFIHSFMGSFADSLIHFIVGSLIQ